MKLPQYNPSGVEKFAAPPAAALAAKGRAQMGEAQALGGIGKVLGEGTTQMAELALRRQEQTEETSVELQRAKYLQDHVGKDYYSGDELPDDIEVVGGRTKTVVDEDGNSVEVPRRIPRAEVFPQLYERHMRGVVDAASGGISSGRRSDEFKQAQTLALEGDITKLKDSAYADMKQSRRDEQDAQRDMFKAAGDFKGARKISAEFEGTDVERQQRVKQDKIEEELAFIAELKATGAETPEQLDLVEKTAADLRDLEGTHSEMPDEARLKAAAELDRTAKMNRLNSDSQLLREEGTEIADMEIAIDENPDNVTAAQVDALYKTNLSMSPEKYAQLQRKLLAKQRAGVGEAIDMNRAMMYLGNDVYISPQDKGVQKALDKWTVDAVKKGADPTKVYTTVARQTGYVPEAAQWEITAANNGYNPQMKEGLSLYNDISRASPHALWSVPDNHTDRLRTVNARMNGGKMSADEAIRQQQDWDLMSPAEKQVVKATTASKDFAKDNLKSLETMISNTPSMEPSGLLQATPNIPPIMASEMDILTEQYMPSVGYNADMARARAFEDIKITWGLTESKQYATESGMTSDYTYMKYPPQASKKEAQASIHAKYGEGEFSIKSDGVTDRDADAGAPLTYSVFKLVDDEQGGVIPEMQPERWTPDTPVEATQRAEVNEVMEARQTDINALEAKKARIKAAADRGLISQEPAAKQIEEVVRQIDEAKAALNREGG